MAYNYDNLMNLAFTKDEEDNWESLEKNIDSVNNERIEQSYQNNKLNQKKWKVN